MVYRIKITSSEEAQKLNRIAEKCPFDVWIHGKQGNADAKSILGLMLLTMEPEVNLVVDDSVDTKHFEKEIEDFLVK